MEREGEISTLAAFTLGGGQGFPSEERSDVPRRTLSKMFLEGGTSKLPRISEAVTDLLNDAIMDCGFALRQA